MQATFAATLIAILLIWNPSKASEEKDGPFGLYMGMPRSAIVDQFGAVKGDMDVAWVLTSVPRPHPALTMYEVWIANGEGVCLIEATGNSDTLSEFLEESQSLRKLLSQELGPTPDRLRSDARDKGWEIAIWDLSASPVHDVEKAFLSSNPNKLQHWVQILFSNSARCMEIWDDETKRIHGATAQPEKQ